MHAMGAEGAAGLSQSPIGSLLQTLWEIGGTDLLLTVGAPPLMRLNGELRPVDAAVLSADDTEMLLAEVLTDEQWTTWKGRREFDFSFSWRDLARVRGNAYTQRGVTAVALRMIPRTIPSMEQLGLPEPLWRFARQHQGLILMTGPTGAGKSTTLASVIDMINQERSCHIVTIEDPIEYVHDHQMSAVDQREVGVDTDCFADALRSVLREDPDVLLVGEMRDLDSIRFALTIAETGHLVFATLHTNDAVQSISRLIDVFPPEQQSQIQVQLAATLSCVDLPAPRPADRRRHDRRVRGPGGDASGAQPHQGGEVAPAAQLAADRFPRRDDHAGAVVVGARPERCRHPRGCPGPQPLPARHRAAAPSARECRGMSAARSANRRDPRRGELQ